MGLRKQLRGEKLVQHKPDDLNPHKKLEAGSLICSPSTSSERWEAEAGESLEAYKPGSFLGAL